MRFHNSHMWEKLAYIKLHVFGLFRYRHFIHRAIPQGCFEGKKCFSTIQTKKKSKETDLLKQLRAKISATGPITIAEYMKEVLINPVSGYYMNRDALGSGGDFITSPEISQMLGELIAVWFLTEWIKVGKPRPLQLVELGPGRGTLADDMLRVFSRHSDIKDAMSVHLVEISYHLRKVQLQTLGCKTINNDGTEISSVLHNSNSNEWKSEQFFSKYGFPVMWYQNIKDVPEGFSFFIAHEFFDALPIHKFQNTKMGWREVLIDIDNEHGEHHLRYILSRWPTPASQLFLDTSIAKNHVEVSPESRLVVQELATRLKEEGGFTLIIDYGHEGIESDTFRAFQKHKLHDPLCEPGEADLTADVDFSYLKNSVNDTVLTFGPIAQERFLKNMAIDIRFQTLMNAATPEIQKNLQSSYDMLINPSKMGKRFKFLALFPMVLKNFLARFPPAGFFE